MANALEQELLSIWPAAPPYDNRATSCANVALAIRDHGLPAKVVLSFNLSAADIAADFTGGLGDSGSDYEGWAICDGNNGTPNLTDKFIRSKVTGSGGSGGSDSGAHTHGLSTNGGAMIRANVAALYWGAAGPSFSYVDKGGFTASSGTGSAASSGLIGDTDSASATENRPAYYELVFLMKV